MNVKMGVIITERVNITKYIFINSHYLRLKEIDGGHIRVVAFTEKLSSLQGQSPDNFSINFLEPQVMHINTNILKYSPFSNDDLLHLIGQ